jgi:predicted metal-dependent HD superfamily phosphohydrolase
MTTKTMTPPPRFRRMWQDLLGPFGAPRDAAERAFANLAARYSCPERHYHTLRHIETMLKLLPEASPALALAVWFHDAVYDTHAADNEECSAALAEEMLQALYIPAEVREEVRRLILLTKRHEATEDDFEGRRLLDADLAILGAKEHKYDRYSDAIRREYAWVAEEDYRRGRRRVLEQFLQRKWIYFTEGVRNERESKARANLRREIAVLEMK